MNDFFPLFAQSGIVALEAAWLTVAVLDNILHPTLNERGFARVLGMDLVKEQDETVYAEVSGRRVDSPGQEKRLFRVLVIAEVVVAGLLWLAALGLFLAALGAIGHAGPRAFAMIAVLGFTAIWSSLLIGGQWFWYRIGMAPAMQVHFFLILWGIATLAFLAAAPS